MIEKHFVTFYSPGTFVAEESTKAIDSWDVDVAKEMAESIEERHNATPYGFRFTTRTRADEDLGSHVSEKSPMYFINCKVETLAEVEARNNPDERILRTNMRANGFNKVVVTTKGWKWTGPLGPDDIVLD